MKTPGSGRILAGGKYTRAEAICKRALLTILEKEELKTASDKILEQALGDEDKG